MGRATKKIELSRWEAFVAETKRYIKRSLQYLRRNWLGTAVTAIATTIFFLPIIANIANYSPGGDAMFNAWTMRRNQNCILRQNCSDYTNANIYYPNQDTMLYSETQLSAGAVTLPFYWVSDNPILAYNVLTIVLFFLSGWGMYLLAKHLSRGNEYVSVLAGLVFAFAPLKIAAIFHLQNLAIFCLPFSILFTLKYFERRSKAYLAALSLSLLYVFFASWVQMVFVLVALGVVLLGYLIFKLATFKQVAKVAVTIGVTALLTVPLALSYVQFSKQTKAGFSGREQVLYSADVRDYVIPYEGTAIGKAYYKLKPAAVRNSLNPDSYSYHGVVLYVVAAFVVVMAFRYRKKGQDGKRRWYQVLTFSGLGLAGLIVSLGPLLKINGRVTYHIAEGLDAVIPAPYIIVNKLLPQLSFIRAIGRASVLFLFVLCCLLALTPYYLHKLKLKQKWNNLALGAVGLLVFVELMPLHLVPMLRLPYTTNWQVPQVYRFIKDTPEVNNIVILNPNYDYPGAPIPIARAEQVMWSGYHNKNIFNGYSGYTPKNYEQDFEDFVDFQADDIPKLRSRNIEYVLVDKELSSQKPWVNDRVAALLPTKVYEDQRYSLYKVN